jgi:hypothetical protein
MQKSQTSSNYAQYINNCRFCIRKFTDRDVRCPITEEIKIQFYSITQMEVKYWKLFNLIQNDLIVTIFSKVEIIAAIFIERVFKVQSLVVRCI